MNKNLEREVLFLQSELRSARELNTKLIDKMLRTEKRNAEVKDFKPISTFIPTRVKIAERERKSREEFERLKYANQEEKE